jgi:hypothetical protein
MISKALMEIYNYLHAEINTANLCYQDNVNNWQLPALNY